MTIIGRVLLGLYKTRDKSYVNVPSEMLDTKDLLKAGHRGPCRVIILYFLILIFTEPFYNIYTLYF